MAAPCVLLQHLLQCMYARTGAEGTGNAGEDCDDDLDPEGEVHLVLIGVGVCDGTHSSIRLVQ